MLFEELVELGRAQSVDLNRLESDDGGRSGAAIDGAHLAQQASGIEDREDHLTVPAPRGDLDPALPQHESLLAGITGAEDDRSSRERLPPAAELEAFRLRVRQPAEEVAFSLIGRGHGKLYQW